MLRSRKLIWKVLVAKTQTDAEAGRFIDERGAGAGERALKRPSRPLGLKDYRDLSDTVLWR